MPLITSGSNATIAVSANQILTVIAHGGEYTFENPVGTRVIDSGSSNVFGPFAAAGSVKLSALQGDLYYELAAGSGTTTIVPFTQIIRSVSATNCLPTNADLIPGGGSAAGRSVRVSRYPVIIGSGPVSKLFVNAAAATMLANIAHTVTIECCIEDGTTVIPVTWNGASSRTLAAGEVDVMSDAILSSAFASPLRQNKQFWIRSRLTVPNASTSRMLRHAVNNAYHITGTQCIDMDSTSTPVNLNASGVFTVGTGMFNAGLSYAPLILGQYVGGIDPPTWVVCGDSIIAGGSSGALSGDSRGGWFQRSQYDSNGQNPKSMIIIAEPGAKADQVLLPNISYAWKYCRFALETLGTNSGISAGNASYLLGLSKAIASSMRADINVAKVVRLKIMQLTSGTFTSDATQTPNTGYTAGGAVDNFNTINLPSAVYPTAGYVYDALIQTTATQSATDPWKWLSTTITTTDGIHPNVAGEGLMATEMRPILGAYT